MNKFKKQPAEVLDYDIDFTLWLPADDALASATAFITDISAPPVSVEPVPALIIDSVDTLIPQKTVKVWLSSGTTGHNYKLTVRALTTDARLKEVEVGINVKDV